MELINRREALRRTSLIMGGALSSSLVTGVLSGMDAPPALAWTPRILTPEQANLVVDLAERILPATDSPGAKQARVVRFIDQMVAEYLQKSERMTFFQGVEILEQKGFREIDIAAQEHLIVELAGEARSQGIDPSQKPFFPLVKEMTLLGFFTSEVGATQVLNYDPIPGPYRGCISLEEAGGKAWAIP